MFLPGESQGWGSLVGCLPQGELLPEPTLVGLAQVAGASVQTGVLNAGVDGHGAVSALRRDREAHGEGGSPRPQ